MNLAQTTAVVTGASGGIGRAVTKRLLAAAATVVAVDKDADALAALQASAREDVLDADVAQRLITYVGDVRDSAAADAAVQIAEQAGAPFGLLVNNAGLERAHKLVDLSDEDLRQMVETNLLGAFYFARAAARAFVAARAGTIVNMCSVTSLRGYAGTSGYSATKFGVNGLTESLQEELRDHRVRVTGIYPGSVATAMLKDVVDASFFSMTLRPEVIADLIVHVAGLSDDVVVEKLIVRPLVERPYSDPVSLVDPVDP